MLTNCFITIFFNKINSETLLELASGSVGTITNAFISSVTEPQVEEKWVGVYVITGDERADIYLGKPELQDELSFLTENFRGKLSVRHFRYLRH